VPVVLDKLGIPRFTNLYVRNCSKYLGYTM